MSQTLHYSCHKLLVVFSKFRKSLCIVVYTFCSFVSSWRSSRHLATGYYECLDQRGLYKYLGCSPHQRRTHLCLCCRKKCLQCQFDACLLTYL